VGNNGAGKTTLLRIMAGETTVDSGTVTVPKGLRIGYLPRTWWNCLTCRFFPSCVQERASRQRKRNSQHAPDDWPDSPPNPLIMNGNSIVTTFFETV
jgi:ABC-type Mn2+/Zn2+ transport system ATPase subunit